MKRLLTVVLVLAGAGLGRCGDEVPLEIVLRKVPPTSIVSNRFEVTMCNTGATEVTIIKPLNGSAWSWYLPFYAFHVKDADGKELGVARRHFISGLYPGTRWPDDYLVVLKPGDKYVRSFDLVLNVPKTAEYTVRFDYVMDTEQDRYRGKLLKYPEAAWQGTASSKPAKFRLTKQRL